MRKLLICTLCVGLLGLMSCDIDQTEEGEMPDVEVSMEEGEMPEYDVDWANVNVGTTTKMVEVPKLVVVMEEEEVEVPVVDVNMPDSAETEERTLIVEAELTGQAREINIVEVYASGKRLYVISRLDDSGQSLEDETMRVSDRLVLNAPEDLEVRHYIIGEKPEGSHNDQYTYISSRNAISDKLTGGKVIYGG